MRDLPDFTRLAERLPEGSTITVERDVHGLTDTAVVQVPGERPLRTWINCLIDADGHLEEFIRDVVDPYLLSRGYVRLPSGLLVKPRRWGPQTTAAGTAPMTPEQVKYWTDMMSHGMLASVTARGLFQAAERPVSPGPQTPVPLSPVRKWASLPLPGTHQPQSTTPVTPSPVESFVERVKRGLGGRDA